MKHRVDCFCLSFLLPKYAAYTVQGIIQAYPISKGLLYSTDQHVLKSGHTNDV